MTNTTTPTLAETIDRTLAERERTHGTRTETVSLRGVDVPLPVVYLPPMVLLLNPRNHRLTAQLEDHPRRDLVHAQPDGADAQQVIADMLRATSDYGKLMTDLRTQGQVNPGIVTRDGRLLNGNTRCVALRDLGEQGMMVAVLPPDVLDDELATLELSLQMRRLTHQEYTFTNRLLLVDEQVRVRGVAPEELARHLNWTRNGRQKVEQHQRILNMIRQLRSEYELPWEFFDDKQQSLEELDKAFTDLRDDPVAAQELRQARLTGLLIGVNKLDLREVDETYFPDLILPRMEPQLAARLRDHMRVSEPTQVDSLEAMLGASTDTFPLRVEPVRRLLMGDPEGELFDGLVLRGELQEQLSNAYQIASNQTRTQRQTQDMLNEPVLKLREVRLQVEQLLDRYDEIHEQPGFDHGKFDYELRQAKVALERLLEANADVARTREAGERPERRRRGR
jgi:hypothetical protein